MTCFIKIYYMHKHVWFCIPNRENVSTCIYRSSGIWIKWSKLSVRNYSLTHINCFVGSWSVIYTLAISVLLNKQQCRWFIVYSLFICSLFTGFSNITSDNITNINTPICDTKKRPSKGIKMLMFGIIGLTALSFIIYMMYIYTRVLENRRMNTGTA